VKHQHVGSTDVGLSVIGLGGAWLGHHADDVAVTAAAAEVIYASLDAGINWLDTSENYYDTGNEAVIGRALRQVDSEFHVCTKVAPGTAISGRGSGFRPEQIASACRGSLERLGRDRIDLYLLHWPDETGVPLDETWGAMAQLVDEGLCRAIGLSNYELADVERCHAQRAVDAIQTGLSLLDYLDDRAMIARCRDLGISVTIYEPVCNGILTETPFEQVRQRWIGTPWEDTSLFRRLLSPESGVHSSRVVDGVRRVARETGATVAQIAIAWVLRQPGVTAAIAGSGRVLHMRENAAAADVILSESNLATLEALIPLGPAFADSFDGTCP
jgi:aryl-alcohol dehydrogenase-like predicted oxidoreductase